MHKVLQENSYWAHPENVVIACLADSQEEVRRKGVQYILEARESFKPECHPRQFIPPTINLEAIDFINLINWELEEKTEPPLTIEFSK